MPYIIETFDRPGHAHVRVRERETHLAFLEQNKALLLACGAKLNDDSSGAGGGVYVVDLNTREEAERFIAADPFSQVDLFERVTITNWCKAYFDGECYL
ncbi:YciI family protein [Paraburkholderia bryophila]|jgi:uncharacterized protein YciI|uniref:YCII-related domain-containing protein n=1 Tax=Paraburkholderia bryophila TaxID=420952 RepID=A0A329BCS4_9BURK|nr:YciI family protein [Paraburkholderia bryophila]RAS20633.1 hypothetical protein BX591_13554 [Paraburkholderia bryophila]